MNEYIVTCTSYEDLQSLYDDLETPGGNLYIPDREVELVHRRQISRNTHYMLTEEEAGQVTHDSRVIACERPARDRGLVPTEMWEQAGDFEKTTGTLESTDKNWGLYRVIKGDSVSNWGSDSTTETTQKIMTTSSGKYVDVVIVDSHINPDHPEFAKNTDGTGGSRVNQFNWFRYSSTLGYSTNDTYTYSTSGASPNSNHGTHVAGTACGNTQGWARNANIYNMAFSDTLSGVTDWDEKLWDYLRHFHKNKDRNPTTGRRNPTITNHSWGYSYGDNSDSLSSITRVTYRGTTTSLSGTDSEKKAILEDNGVPVPTNTYLYRVPARVAAVDADIQDAINDGVIVISSAGNSYWNCDTSSGSDYNNSYYTSSTRYHSRGSTPGSADNVICVGSIGSKVSEYKSNFSNWGGRVDIWAPGSDIISAVYDKTSADAASYGSVVVDSRSASYYIASINGTSMASPQVCGVIACLAEQEPRLRQSDALQYLKESSLSEVGTTGTENHSGYEALGSNSNNRYLFIMKKRPEHGSTYPSVLDKNRHSEVSGPKYPRFRNNRVIK